jgi:GNAT superfamily N-acetyltransferase
VIERLTLEHLPGCLDLASDRDWSREEGAWRLLFDIGDVVGIVEPDGSVVGTAAVARVPPSAALSMVLVAERRERRGLGGALVRAALERAGNGRMYLFATEYGRPLYERLGFEITGSVTTHAGRWHRGPDDAARPARDANSGSRPARDDDWDAIAALDAAVVGVDRRNVIERLDAFASEVRVVERDGRIVGYGARWSRAESVQIGPIIAPDLATARILIADLAVPDAPLRLDVNGPHRQLMTWVQSHGLAPYPPSARMDYGPPPPRDETRLFAAFMQPLG